MEYVKSFSKDVTAIIKTLSNIDDLESWNKIRKNAGVELREVHLNFAMYLWIERMLRDEKLLIHPFVKQELIERNYKPLTKHKKMIWASLLSTYEGSDSKERFNRIKRKITKHYSPVWWLDVYNIHNQVRVVYLKLRRINESNGKGLSFMATKSTLIAHAISEEKEKVMLELPTELSPRISTNKL